ncbi:MULTISPECIES: DUF4397 domain-containing protein [Halorussus]|uniref:DUF4397 domain-containing protein n=1 Tax=Halorussus TaxID=1070314 RepID=UPI0020A21810|nr:DUF4397 domain-containing protein [Halorussus vallis]USZ74462.1 DUF4397 domain-containing protein [Halorussus vallis]
MTNERPTQDARCWLLNTADRAVDVYVNYRETPLTTIQPTEDQGVFSIDSDANGTYGTYTFEARAEGNLDGEVLASVSVEFTEGDSYSAVFHRSDDATYELSVYENDFSPSDDSRFEIRHTGAPERIDWRLFPKSEADPRISDDERSGSLSRAQWQQAIDVTENDYRLEIVVDGKVVAFRQDLELEANRAIVVYLVDDPKWWMGSDEKEDHIFRQEFQVQSGPDRDDVVTPPAEPYATTDRNQTIQFACRELELYHTNRAETTVEATDPDGIVADLAVGEVEPYSDGFKIPDESVERAYAIGGITTGTLTVRPKVPPGDYDVELVANPEGLGERATCTRSVKVKKITVHRLRNLVDRYREAGEMTDEIAAQLRDSLDDAVVHLDAGELAEACDALKRVVTVVGENKDEGISVAAAVDIETETKAMRKHLGCG